MQFRQVANRLAGVGLLAACLLAGPASSAALFSGIFAPSNWTPDPSNDPLAVINWIPDNINATALEIKNSTAVGSQTTSIILAPVHVTEDVRLRFNWAFDLGDSNAGEAFIAINNVRTTLSTLTGTGSEVMDIGAGSEVVFGVYGENPAGKKVPATLLIDELWYSPVPEPSLIAGAGLLGLFFLGHSLKQRAARRSSQD